MSLTKQECKQLKGAAHDLKAIVNVGKEGFTDQFIKGVSDALSSRELIKVKFLEHSELHPSEDGKLLAEKIDAEWVGSIGSVAIIYRRSDKIKVHVLDSLSE